MHAPGKPVDPDCSRNITELIRTKGYPVEEHDVVTEDGYILTILRIPHGKQGPARGGNLPVILQHGLIDWGFSWVLNYPDEALAYILADAGYVARLGGCVEAVLPVAGTSGLQTAAAPGSASATRPWIQPARHTGRFLGMRWPSMISQRTLISCERALGMRRSVISVIARAHPRHGRDSSYALS